MVTISTYLNDSVRYGTYTPVLDTSYIYSYSENYTQLRITPDLQGMRRFMNGVMYLYGLALLDECTNCVVPRRERYQ